MMLRQLMLDTWNILEMCKLGKVMRPFPAAVLRQVGGKRFVSGCFRMVSELSMSVACQACRAKTTCRRIHMSEPKMGIMSWPC